LDVFTLEKGNEAKKRQVKVVIRNLSLHVTFTLSYNYLIAYLYCCKLRKEKSYILWEPVIPKKQPNQLNIIMSM